jgi:phenylacetate-CoA ligase
VLEHEASERFARLASHAFRTVPHYQEAWSAVGVDSATVMTLRTLPRLPIVTKDTINAARTRLLSTSFHRDHLDVECTSGTTHARTEIYRDHACSVARFGRQWGVLRQCGYRPGDRRGLLWGVKKDLLQPGQRLPLRTRLRRYASADEVFCCTVIEPLELREYYERLRLFQPRVLYGYPSALYHLATFIRDEGLEPIRVERIICTAERLHPAHRAAMTEVFGGEVFNLYCTREHGCIGFECGRHNGFHVDIGSVVVEIVRDGEVMPPGEHGHIVVTDLLNHGMPLVRNLIGDVGVLSQETCGCGSPLPLLSGLDGRIAEMLYRPDGSSVVGWVLTFQFQDLPWIRLAQFVQMALGEVDVNVVLRAGTPSDGLQTISQRIGNVLGSSMIVRVNPCHDIERNPSSGKIQEVVCRISPPSSVSMKRQLSLV